MTLGKLLSEERELMFRSLALTGVHVVVSLASLKLSENELETQEVKEIHLLDPVQLLTDRMEDLKFKFKGMVNGWHVFAPEHLVLHQKGFDGSFKRGDIVQLNMSFSKSSAGTTGFVTDREGSRITVVTQKDDKFTIH